MTEILTWQTLLSFILKDQHSALDAKHFEASDCLPLARSEPRNGSPEVTEQDVSTWEFPNALQSSPARPFCKAAVCGGKEAVTFTRRGSGIQCWAQTGR